MRPYNTTVIRTDMIFIHKLTIMVSIPSPISSPMPIAESWLLNMVVSVVVTSMLVEPDMTPAAFVTIWLPTSKIAIVMSKVLLSNITAIHAFTR